MVPSGVRYLDICPDDPVPGAVTLRMYALLESERLPTPGVTRVLTARSLTVFETTALREFFLAHPAFGAPADPATGKVA